jgi:signal recognition particle subunit SRP19
MGFDRQFLYHKVIRRFVAKKDKPMVLYPAYFDSGRSREEGRRVPRSMAIPGPRVEEVHQAAKAVGLQAIIDPDRSHPTTPFQKEGRVLIQGNYVKTSVIRKIAENLKTTRASSK